MRSDERQSWGAWRPDVPAGCAEGRKWDSGPEPRGHVWDDGEERQGVSEAGSACVSSEGHAKQRPGGSAPTQARPGGTEGKGPTPAAGLASHRPPHPPAREPRSGRPGCPQVPSAILRLQSEVFFGEIWVIIYRNCDKKNQSTRFKGGCGERLIKRRCAPPRVTAQKPVSGRKSSNFH